MLALSRLVLAASVALLAVPALALELTPDQDKMLTCAAELFIIGAAQDDQDMVAQSGDLEGRFRTDLAAAGASEADLDTLVEAYMGKVDDHLGSGAEPMVPVEACKDMAQ